MGEAVARVRLMSPPLPGSDVMVPHCSPAAALANTAWRCSSQSGCDGSGDASQNATTAGCMHDTSATDGSADASPRYISHMARADDSALSHSPPASRGAGSFNNPASREAIEVGTIQVAPRLPLGPFRAPSRRDLVMERSIGSTDLCRSMAHSVPSAQIVVRVPTFVTSTTW